MKGLVSTLLHLLMKLPGADTMVPAYVRKHHSAKLREALWNPDQDTDFQQALLGEDHAHLKAYLSRDEDALLRQAVAERGKTLEPLLLATFSTDTLCAFFFSNDYARFKALALHEDCAPLRHVLAENDYARLRDLLARRGHEALKGAILQGPDALYRTLAIAEGGARIAAILFEEDARVLRDILRQQADESLLPLFRAEKERFLSLTETDELLTALGERIGASHTIDAFLQQASLRQALHAEPRWRASTALYDSWESLSPWLPREQAKTEAGLTRGLIGIHEPAHVRGRLLDAITQEDIVHLAHGTLRFPCRHSLWTLLHEILLHEDYFFPTDTDTPRIIDGGTHMGMAIYYFKTRYPKAHITGFEPDPALRAMAEENVARNHYEDVTVLPYALAPTRGEVPFYRSEIWTMAGALDNRRSQLGDTLETIQVESVPLSEYLDGPIDFLKLDIEGAEADVLLEAAEKLPNVAWLFCEVHLGGGAGSERLAQILTLLEAADFDVQVAKSHNYQTTSRHRPFTHFDGAASMIVWARNRRNT